MHLSRSHLLVEKLRGVEGKRTEKHWKMIVFFLGVWFQMPPQASLNDLSVFFTRFVGKQNLCLVWKSDWNERETQKQSRVLTFLWLRFWQIGFACRELQRILKLVVCFHFICCMRGLSAAKLSFELAPFCPTTAIITHQLLSHQCHVGLFLRISSSFPREGLKKTKKSIKSRKLKILNEKKQTRKKPY